MSLYQEKETPVYHLLSYYSNKTLRHGTWLASFIISIFAFMGLRLRFEAPLNFGSFAILFVLGFFSSYVLGRLLYYVKVVQCLLSTPMHACIIKSFSMSIGDVNKEIPKIFKKKTDKFAWWFAWQFKSSFGLRTIITSGVLGVSIAIVLFKLSWMVLNFG